MLTKLLLRPLDGKIRLQKTVIQNHQPIVLSLPRKKPQFHCQLESTLLRMILFIFFIVFYPLSFDLLI
jgi:hypothetical protein